MERALRARGQSGLDDRGVAMFLVRASRARCFQQKSSCFEFGEVAALNQATRGVGSAVELLRKARALWDRGASGYGIEKWLHHALCGFRGSTLSWGLGREDCCGLGRRNVSGTDEFCCDPVRQRGRVAACADPAVRPSQSSGLWGDDVSVACADVDLPGQGPLET